MATPRIFTAAELVAETKEQGFEPALMVWFTRLGDDEFDIKLSINEMATGVIAHPAFAARLARHLSVIVKHIVEEEAEATIQ